MSNLDITSWKKKSMQELGQEIVDTVKDTQRVIIQPYPDKIIMTLQQYNTLNGRPPMTPLSFTNRLFRTKYNIMDILVEGYTDKGEPKL